MNMYESLKNNVYFLKIYIIFLYLNKVYKKKQIRFNLKYFSSFISLVLSSNTFKNHNWYLLCNVRHSDCTKDSVQLRPIICKYLNTNMFIGSNVNSTFLGHNNSYFFFLFFNKDPLISFFINIIMRNGKKNLALSTLYRSFFFIKKKTSIQPLLIVKKFLSKHRIIYDMLEEVKYKKIKYVPKLVSLRSQITRTFRYMFNDFTYLKLETPLLKKHVPFYKKMSYIILNSVFHLGKIRKILKRDRKALRFNFHHVDKEEFFSKFLNKVEDIYRRKFFKVRRKSLDKKGKYLKKRKSFFKHYREKEYLHNHKWIKKYELNVLARFRIKSKWT